MTIDVSDAFLPVPGGRVFTRRWCAGRDEASPIVLLHDSLGSVELWREFPAALARACARPVVAYDRLGYGRSARRDDPPDPGFIRDEAAVTFPAVARGLGIASCVVFGHSIGGGMALVIAATHPGLCRAVITEAAQACVEPGTLAGIREAKASFGDPENFARLVRWHGDKARWVLDAWAEVWLAPEFQSWTLDAVLPSVRCPVLAIHGELDEYGSEAFPRRIAAGVAGPARVEILAGCGHVPHRERAEDVLRLAASFLGEHGA